ncbi:hypothetical protein [Providencia rettgeri]|uniref:hypothetical protein n=1 Tax=Providencia rettgeri TaxID=587 RepID=UPI001CA700FA
MEKTCTSRAKQGFMRNYKKIRNGILSGLLFSFAGLIDIAQAEVTLGAIPVQIQLTNLPKITVEKPGGGWYDTLELSNQSGTDVSLYKASVPVRVNIWHEQHFKVSLLGDLVLAHELNPSLTFTVEKIAFGSTLTAQQNLSTVPTAFMNPPLVGDNSTGDYSLSIVARQPNGQLSGIAGHYVGSLTLIFEVDI